MYVKKESQKTNEYYNNIFRQNVCSRQKNIILKIRIIFPSF